MRLSTLEKQKQLVRRAEIRQYLINVLGGKCVICGSTDKLEFDHIDPTTKSFNIAPRLSTGNLSSLIAEAKKCQLLCKLHHDEKTAREKTVDMPHGTTSRYNCRKCRCSECRAAQAAYARSYRKRAKANIMEKNHDTL